MLPSHNLGTPPYCLKCQEVGHIRSRCPTNNRSFPGLFKSNRTSAGAGALPKAPVPQIGAGTRSKDPAPFSVDAVAVSADVVAVSTDAMSVGGAAVSFGLEANEAGWEQQLRSMFDTADDEEIVEMNEKRSKRCREFSADEDYITPNKTAKTIPWAEESNSIETSNPYDELGVDSLMGSK